MEIIIIGTGNVATHLAKELNKTKNKIIQVISRNIKNAKELAEKIDCKYSNKIDDIAQADLYILSVTDNAIEQIARHKKLQAKFIVHTSGSVDMKIFEKSTKQYGVFYPLQTFNKKNDVDFSEIPICIEASGKKEYEVLEKIAKNISKNVISINSTQRKKLHIAAVFVNNYVNHLFTLANKIVEQENVDSEILKHLIATTFEKIMKNNAFDIQTGPAKRNDTETIIEHLKILNEYPHNYSEVYKIMSESIINTYKN